MGSEWRAKLRVHSVTTSLQSLLRDLCVPQVERSYVTSQRDWRSAGDNDVPVPPVQVMAVGSHSTTEPLETTKINAVIKIDAQRGATHGVLTVRPATLATRAAAEKRAADFIFACGGRGEQTARACGGACGKGKNEPTVMGWQGASLYPRRKPASPVWPARHRISRADARRQPAVPPFSVLRRRRTTLPRPGRLASSHPVFGRATP